VLFRSKYPKELTKLTEFESFNYVQEVEIIQGYEKLSPAKAREIIFNNSEIKIKVSTKI
jgi:hypothetical protein